ncbi:hypothetical protein [Halobacillus faecis]|nr:hypothetical protein [Halobacillus faecis]
MTFLFGIFCLSTLIVFWQSEGNFLYKLVYSFGSGGGHEALRKIWFIPPIILLLAWIKNVFLHRTYRKPNDERSTRVQEMLQHTGTEQATEKHTPAIPERITEADTIKAIERPNRAPNHVLSKGKKTEPAADRENHQSISGASRLKKHADAMHKKRK